MANKVKYGIKNVYYAVLGSTGYGTPVAMPGAVSISLAPQGGTEQFYADNISYFKTEINNGYSGDLELALIPDSFLTDVLGNTLDTTSKVLTESADINPVTFALGFQVEGDDNASRFWYYNCTATRPTEESETKNDTLNIQTETITITATPNEDGVVRARTTADTPTATYTGWFSTVFEVA